MKNKEGRKTATAEDIRECERRQNSRVGRASEHDAGEFYTQSKEQNLNETTKIKSGDAAIRTSSIASKDDPFQSAPKLTQAFNVANTATTAPLATLDSGAPYIATRDLKSTGLAI